MPKVILESWRYGYSVLSLTLLQRDMLGIGLKEAKTNADNLLKDLGIILEIDDENLAKDFFEKADQVGVNCKLIK